MSSFIKSLWQYVCPCVTSRVWCLSLSHTLVTSSVLPVSITFTSHCLSYCLSISKSVLVSSKVSWNGCFASPFLWRVAWRAESLGLGMPTAVDGNLLSPSSMLCRCLGDQNCILASIRVCLHSRQSFVCLFVLQSLAVDGTHCLGCCRSEHSLWSNNKASYLNSVGKHQFRICNYRLHLPDSAWLTPDLSWVLDSANGIKTSHLTHYLFTLSCTVFLDVWKPHLR